MKILTSLLLTICLIFSGCSQESESTESTDVSLILQDYSSTGATFTLENNSGAEYTYGEPYNLQVYKYLNWRSVSTVIDNWGFTSIGYTLNKNSSSQEIAIDWEWLYGELPAGKYKLTKNIDKYPRYYSVSAEFEIE